SPSNLTIAGDSTSANLIPQLISHTLNPLPINRVPRSPRTPTQPESGILLISPWLLLDQQMSSHVQNDASDCITSDTMITNRQKVLAGIKDTHVLYMKVLSAGEQWFDGIGELAN
ncbi:hypothetical protein L218DRAFT_873620, partial [Marasmius fiardii PR-910]